MNMHARFDSSLDSCRGVGPIFYPCTFNDGGEGNSPQYVLYWYCTGRVPREFPRISYWIFVNKIVRKCDDSGYHTLPRAVSLLRFKTSLICNMNLKPNPENPKPLLFPERDTLRPLRPGLRGRVHVHRWGGRIPHLHPDSVRTRLDTGRGRPL